MGLILGNEDAQTPLDEDEREALLIPTITTQKDLNEFEQLGVDRARAWTKRRTFPLEQILSEGFLRELHRRMFAGIWRWAGEFRTSNKNLGVDKLQIRSELKKLLDDCRYWIDHKVFLEDEIAVRFSHRLVTIHPFVNGNGRHCRLATDILVSHGLGRPHFTWGSVSLAAQGEARTAYLKALREADDGRYQQLIEFARQ